MPECMHMSEPGSVLLAAFPNQCATHQEGNDKIHFPEILKRETIFSSEGKVHHVSSTCSESHRTSKDSSLLSWTESLPPFTARLRFRTSSELKDQMLHCFFLTAPHFICAREEQEASELELPSAQKLSGVSHSVHAQVDNTNTLSPPPASGGHKLISPGKGCALSVCQGMTVLCMSLLPFHLQHMENCFTAQEALCRCSYGCKPSSSLNASSFCDPSYLRH